MGERRGGHGRWPHEAVTYDCEHPSPTTQHASAASRTRVDCSSVVARLCEAAGNGVRRPFGGQGQRQAADMLGSWPAAPRGRDTRTNWNNIWSVNSNVEGGGLSGFKVEGGKLNFCESWGRKNRLFLAAAPFPRTSLRVCVLQFRIGITPVRPSQLPTLATVCLRLRPGSRSPARRRPPTRTSGRQRPAFWQARRPACYLRQVRQAAGHRRRARQGAGTSRGPFGLHPLPRLKKSRLYGKKSNLFVGVNHRCPVWSQVPDQNPAPCCCVPSCLLRSTRLRLSGQAGCDVACAAVAATADSRGARSLPCGTRSLGFSLVPHTTPRWLVDIWFVGSIFAAAPQLQVISTVPLRWQQTCLRILLGTRP